MTPTANFIQTKNGGSLAISDLPTISIERLRQGISEALQSPTARVLAFFAIPWNVQEEGRRHRLIAIVGDGESHTIQLAAAPVADAYDALTPAIPALHLFEREIAEQYGITPKGHPWLKPIRFHRPLNDAIDAWNRPSNTPIEPAVTEHFALSGEAAHEVAVGPVHAGVIEPGHFRFQCLGEDVHHLEISLGYQHRNIEQMMEGGPNPRSIHFAETAAGDTTIASTWNYAALVESLTSLPPSADTLQLRRILLELERIANHIGDLGALANDVAYLPTAAYCGRIRGEYLNMTAEITGNRFGRNTIVPGGMRQTLTPAQTRKIFDWIHQLRSELDNALSLMFEEPSVLDRLENTGSIDADTARRIGMVGVAGRASNQHFDARSDFPHSGETDPITGIFATDGDVLARATIRAAEIKASQNWLTQTLETAVDTGLIDTRPPPTLPPLAPDTIAIAITEAWRGELVHIALTDEAGHFRRYKIIDPSFHNWFGLALDLRGEQISHFPICNKSFNLSYCGHDL